MQSLIVDAKGKKRRAETPTAKGAPPVKKAAVPSSAATTPKAVPVKKDSKQVVKDAKSDSSFFSKPKPTKKEMPSFKKIPPAAMPLVKKEPDVNIAQPSSFNPFEDILKSYGSSAGASGSTSTPPPGPIAGPSTAGPSNAGPSTAGTPGFTKKGKPKRSVTWAADDKLEQIKLIDRAVYDDDPASVSPFRSYQHMYCMLIRRHSAALHRACKPWGITSATLTETRVQHCTPTYSTSKSNGQSHSVSARALHRVDPVTDSVGPPPSPRNTPGYPVDVATTTRQPQRRVHSARGA